MFLITNLHEKQFSLKIKSYEYILKFDRFEDGQLMNSSNLIPQSFPRHVQITNIL